MSSSVIKHQHLFLKLAIFAIGISTGFEASLRQIVSQSLLICLYMLLEVSLYRKLSFALRKMLPFFAAYWIFATLFSLEFTDTLLYCIQIVYFILIMIASMGSFDSQRALYQCTWCLNSKVFSTLIYFALSTSYFLREYFRLYRSLPPNDNFSKILEKAIETGHNVYKTMPQIEQKVQGILSSPRMEPISHPFANLIGLCFLCCLGLVHSI